MIWCMFVILCVTNYVVCVNAYYVFVICSHILKKSYCMNDNDDDDV